MKNTPQDKSLRIHLARRSARFIIAIDPGVNTGLAIFDRHTRTLLAVKSMTILAAIREVTCCADSYRAQGHTVLIRIEDARLRTWFGEKGREALQGAGSIKRDCSIWEEAMSDIRAPFEFVAPRSNKTKVNAARFRMLTKWEGSTNEHSRDAGMLAFLS